MPTGLFEEIKPPAPPDPYETQQALAQQANAVGYQAQPFTVGTNQTVAGQLDTIIDKNSPLMQQAERRAKQAMNERGLLNSSIAVGAGQDAVIGQALPIATADAGTFDRAMTNTVNAKNAAEHFRAGAENQTSLANAQLGTNVSLANTEAANRAKSEGFQAASAHKLAGFDASTRMALANLDAQTRTSLANIDGQYRQLLQSNQSAASMFNQVAQNISTITQSTTLDEAGKNNAITSQLNLLNEALKTTAAIGATEGSAVGSLDLSQYFQNTGGTLARASSGPARQPIPTPTQGEQDYGAAVGVPYSASAGGYVDRSGNVWNTVQQALDSQGGAPSGTAGTRTRPSQGELDYAAAMGVAWSDEKGGFQGINGTVHPTAAAALEYNQGNTFGAYSQRGGMM